MKKHYILISESKIGVHSKNHDGQRLPFEIFDLPFIPNTKIEEGGNIKFFVADQNTMFQEVVARYFNLEHEYDVTILVGYDLDFMGEIMSSAAREILISKGVKKNKIIRTPLTQHGYIAIKDFCDVEAYKKYLFLQDQFIIKQKRSGIKNPIGFQKVSSLELLKKYSGKTTWVNSDASSRLGTSTITCITKFLEAEGLKDEQ